MHSIVLLLSLRATHIEIAVCFHSLQGFNFRADRYSRLKWIFETPKETKLAILAANKDDQLENKYPVESENIP